jgi:hypothetical protein
MLWHQHRWGDPQHLPAAAPGKPTAVLGMKITGILYGFGERGPE